MVQSQGTHKVTSALKASSWNIQPYGRGGCSRTETTSLREANRRTDEIAEVNLAKMVTGQLFMQQKKAVTKRRAGILPRAAEWQKYERSKQKRKTTERCTHQTNA